MRIPATSALCWRTSLAKDDVEAEKGVDPVEERDRAKEALTELTVYGSDNRMEIPSFTERIAKQRKCSPELVRAIVTDCLSSLHESVVKQGIGAAQVGAWFELGPQAAWHLGGLLAEATTYEAGELMETYLRLDSSMMHRFRSLLDRWKYEADRDQEERK
jgi:hypothetical protein